MRRDTDEGKPRYDLIDEPFLTRLAQLMARGAIKYGEENWRLANSEAELKRFQASGFRHFIQWLRGDDDEDHMAAVAYNLMACEYVKRRINESRTPSSSSDTTSEVLTRPEHTNRSVDL